MRDTIGPYKILRKIGRGGMGEVFRALDPAHDRIVAIKILRPFQAMIDIVGYDRLQELFVTEAETMSFLDCSFVVDVLDTGRDEDGSPYFVMEFYCNNLGRMIGESFMMEKMARRIRAEKVLDYGAELLRGISHIHHARVVHRDIKPYNIMVTDDEHLRLLDFGMALVDDVSLTGLEHVRIGSPFYSPPEQNIDPAAVDGRSDLYSIGVLLYRMLTGEFPSMRDFSLSRVNRQFDRAWDDFFARALSLQPDGRFQTADEMAEALARLAINKSRFKPESGDDAESSGSGTVSLRDEPVNVCGKKAVASFGIDAMLQPENLIRNEFADLGDGTFLDRSTSLIWHGGESENELAFSEAAAYIARLNEMNFAGHANWRLPTVPELVSLFGSSWTFWDYQEKPRSGWLWSGDLHGKQDAWYANLEMGYVDWQDVTCRNFVKAVCSKT